MTDPRHPHAPHRLARRTLLACEGRATERGYFEALRKHLKLPADVLHVLDTPATTPLALVKAVVLERDRRIEARAFDPRGGDACWVVCDGDEHRRSDARGWDAAWRLARAEGVKVAVSNPSFELWYLLHFADQHAALDAREAREKLKRHVPGYTKAQVLFPDPLATRTADAVRRAKVLDQRAAGEGLGPFANPSSGVQALVAELLGPAR
jgi:hypothetical protein